MSALPTNTSERILEASLKLFNEYGFQNVPVLRIATHMGISSGNLAYHFKTKTDIVLAVFPLLEKALRDTKQREGPFLPSSAALHQIEVFHTLWRYRFFFNALTKLLSEDAELHRRFMRLQDTVITAMQELFDELIQQKYMYPVKPPNNTRLLAKSCWMMWLSWLRFEQIEHPRRQTVRSAAVYEAVMLNWSIVQPYFPDDFARNMMAELEAAIAACDAAQPKAVRTRRQRNPG